MARISFLYALMLFLMLPVSYEPAQAQQRLSAFRSTPYPLPRYVTLRAERAFVRTGPGLQYPIKWEYQKQGLPVEIVLEFENWRKIKDFQGDEGWVHQSLLSGERKGLIQNEGGNNNVALYDEPEPESPLEAYLEPKLLVSLERCKKGWCEVRTGAFKGWVEQKFIWGVYLGEDFD